MAETLRDFISFEDNNPCFKHARIALTSRDEGKIVESIEWLIKNAIRKLVSHKRHKQNLSEDAITVSIIEILEGGGLPFQHDTEIGGHTDISICIRDEFLWIGEAKLWEGPGSIYKGFKQLISRYSTGLPGELNGGILIYFYKRDVKKLMEKWANKMLEEENVTCEDIDGLDYRSTHVHPSSGLDFCIRHFAVPLLFQPEDK